jgi:uncharacterized membrane protein YhaH (DUF805 family)
MLTTCSQAPKLVTVKRFKDIEYTGIGIYLLYVCFVSYFWIEGCYKFQLSYSHLVVETSQQMNDIPYGDYFHVEARLLAKFLILLLAGLMS